MMPSKNKIIVAAAGSGKTTRIVDEILAQPNRRFLVVTYTLNNVGEIKRKFYQKRGSIPANATVMPWFSFLLQDFVRPYQNYVYDKRIESISFNEGKSVPFVKEANIKAHYFADGKDVYRDKISKFSCLCNEKSGELVIKRLADIYDHIYIDEVQDLAGYDLELIEILFSSKIGITLVGDHRQSTFQTNNSPKNKQYAGAKIIEKFTEWEKNSLCEIEYLQTCYRCNQTICDLADAVYPNFPKTSSANSEITGHDGIFIIPNNKVHAYLGEYSPQILRYNKTTDCLGHHALNFGDSKGLTFNRVLIFPHGPIKNLIKTGDFQKVSGSAAKFYVATTRARYSVGFVYDGNIKLSVTGVY